MCTSTWSFKNILFIFSAIQALAKYIVHSKLKRRQLINGKWFCKYLSSLALVCMVKCKFHQIEMIIMNVSVCYQFISIFWSVFVGLLCINDLCNAADKYYPKCYCPGTDPALASSQFKELRDLMYVKRREYTNADSGFPSVYRYPGIYWWKTVN